MRLLCRCVLYMELTVLVDNNTLIDRYFLGEPGFAAYIRHEGLSVLFDTGYSDVVVRNAMAMGIDLMQLDAVVLSHGHIDHTGGLPALLQHRLGAATEHRAAAASPEFVFHPAALAVRTAGGLGNIGAAVGREALAAAGTLRETRGPLWLGDSMVFLGEVPTGFAFEARPALGKLHLPGGTEPDLVPDDSALACLTGAGLVVVTGCAHAGVCSVVEYAKEVTGCDRVADIVGGFHLYDAGDGRIHETAKYLKEIGPAALHPCHCTGKRAVCRLAGVAPGAEVGVGLRLEF